MHHKDYMTKYKVTIQEPVTIPATSTESPEQQFTFASFVEQFIMRSDGMRSEDNIPLLARLCDSFIGRTLVPGDAVELDDDVWTAARDSAKSELDQMMVPIRGRNPLPMPVALPLLKMYHGFAK